MWVLKVVQSVWGLTTHSTQLVANYVFMDRHQDSCPGIEHTLNVYQMKP